MNTTAEFKLQMDNFDKREYDVIRFSSKGRFHRRPFNDNYTLCGRKSYGFPCIFAWPDTPDYADKCKKCS